MGKKSARNRFLPRLLIASRDRHDLYAFRVRHPLEHLDIGSRAENFGIIARRRLQPPAAYAFGLATRLIEPGARRAGVYTKSPTASEIVSNYTRGWVLFGLSLPGVSGLEWHRFSHRAVITQDTARIPKRVREVQRRQELEVRFDEDFEEIVARCREGRSGWLSDETVVAYRKVNELGFSATVGAYRDGRLVGGMWGITVGRAFCIMSMFHLEDNAGSLALAAVAERVMAGDRWSLVDVILLNPNVRRYGAREIPTEAFCDLIWASMPPAR